MLPLCYATAPAFFVFIGQDSKPLPRPDNWGGYRVIPDTIEFWQGQSTRIHDRLRFRKPDQEENLDPEKFVEAENGWIIERLSP